MAGKQPRRGGPRGGGSQTHGEDMEAMMDAWNRLGTDLQGDSGGRQQRGRSRTRWPRWGPEAGPPAHLAASSSRMGAGAAQEEGPSQEEGACGPLGATGEAGAETASSPCRDVWGGPPPPRESEDSEGSEESEGARRRRERKAAAPAQAPRPEEVPAMSGPIHLALGARPRQPMGGRGRGRPRGRGQSRGEARAAAEEAGPSSRWRAASPSPPPVSGPRRYSLRSRARAAAAAAAAAAASAGGLEEEGAFGAAGARAFQDPDATGGDKSPRRKRGPRRKLLQISPEVDKSNSDEDEPHRLRYPEEDDEVDEEDEEDEGAGAGWRRLQPRIRSRIEKKVCELVQYLLIKEQSKVPIQRADIVNTVIKEYKDRTTEIISRAGQMLEQVFGMELKEIDDAAPAYVLLNRLKPLEEDYMRPQKQDTAKMGLVMVILSLIFMKGNCAKESVVWDMLRKMRLNPDQKHPVFGNVKKLVTDEFVRQRYLEYNRIPHSDPEEYEFLWGPRAFLETSKMQVLRFMAKIQKRDPQSWAIQYNEALQEEAGAAADTASASAAIAAAAASSAEDEAEDEAEAQACACASASFLD